MLLTEDKVQFDYGRGCSYSSFLRFDSIPISDFPVQFACACMSYKTRDMSMWLKFSHMITVIIVLT